MLKSIYSLFGDLKKYGLKATYKHAFLIYFTKMHDLRKEKYITLYWLDVEKKYNKFNTDQIKNILKKKYEDLIGYSLNYENPKTFTEKIQYMKIYDSTRQKTVLADKYKVRNWIEDKVGKEHLIPLIGVWDRFDDIDFSQLPNSFCLKTNHGSGMNMIVKNKNEIDLKEVKTLFDWWMKRPFWVYTIEPHYKEIPRRIIAEEYIEELDGGLYDYKFHCFHGKPVFIQCIGDRNLEKHTGYQKNYDIDWNELDWIFEDYPSFPYSVPKPNCLSEMLFIAERLSSEFDYVRVDLYEVRGKVYFGEMTFTPGSGNYPYKGTWTREKDEVLGKLI